MIGNDREKRAGKRRIFRARLLTAAAAICFAALACAHASASPEAARTGLSREETLRRAKSVLGDGRFQKEFPKAREPVRRESEAASGPVHGAGYVLSILAWTVIAAVIALLAWAAVSALARSGILAKVLPRTKPEAPGSAAVVGPVPEKKAVADADAKASAGFYIDAVRLLFVESARMVEQAAAIRLDPAITNGEYLGALGPGSKYLKAMSAIALVVDACFYGNRECTRDDWLECRAAFESLSHPSVEAAA